MASDYTVELAVELETAAQLRASQFIFPHRPWLDLYGINVRPVAPFGSASSKQFVDPALIHRVLPDELLFEILSKTTPYTLGKAACVCRKWRYTIRNPVFWRNACLKAWQVSGLVENYKVLHLKYDGSWRKMWLLRPRIRTDGIYVSRNTYIRAGIAEWKITNPVHLVCYYRYMRFYPSGRFLYKNSSQKVKDVAKYLNFRASKADCVFKGNYTLSEDKVEAALLYPGMRPTVLRFRLRLRGTTQGANNRMDLLALLTSGVNDNEVNGPDEDILGVVERWEEDETHNPDVPAISHKRGLTPFVFVSFEEVSLSFTFVRRSPFFHIKQKEDPGGNFSSKSPSGKNGLLCSWLRTGSNRQSIGCKCVTLLFVTLLFLAWHLRIGKFSMCCEQEMVSLPPRGSGKVCVHPPYTLLVGLMRFQWVCCCRKQDPIEQ